MTQQQLAQGLNVSRSSIANWEAGNRRPGTSMLFQIARLLNVDASTLLATADYAHETPNVLIVDDNSIALRGGVSVLRDALSNVNVIGLSSPKQALDYAREHPVALAFLDIRIETASGLDLCRRLLQVNPNTNVIYLTAYPEFALDAWGTGACGFMLKPLEAEAVRRQVQQLRHPVHGLL
jgi:CheY-like chemotaxis protein